MNIPLLRSRLLNLYGQACAIDLVDSFMVPDPEDLKAIRETGQLIKLNAFEAFKLVPKGECKPQMSVDEFILITQLANEWSMVGNQALNSAPKDQLAGLAQKMTRIYAVACGWIWV